MATATQQIRTTTPKAMLVMVSQSVDGSLIRETSPSGGNHARLGPCSGQRSYLSQFGKCAGIADGFVWISNKIPGGQTRRSPGLKGTKPGNVGSVPGFPSLRNATAQQSYTLLWRESGTPCERLNWARTRRL